MNALKAALGGGAVLAMFNQVNDRLDPVEKWRDTIRLAGFDLGVGEAVLAGMVARESAGDPDAIGDQGHPTGEAIGLLQVRPPALADVKTHFPGRFDGVDHEDLKGDPTLQIYVGAAYLKYLLDRFNGNPFVAVTAYNRGPSKPTPISLYAADVMLLAWVWDIRHSFGRWNG